MYTVAERFGITMRYGGGAIVMTSLYAYFALSMYLRFSTHNLVHTFIKGWINVRQT